MIKIKSREALVTFLAVMTAIVTFIIFISIVYENAQFLKLASQNYANEQLALVQSVSKQIKNSIEQGRSDQEVVPNVLRSQVQSASRKWFVYKNEVAFYEGPELVPADSKGRTLAERTDVWRRNGAEGLSEFFDLIANDKSGSCLITREASTGKEILSLVPVKINGSRYLIGLATSQKYMLAMTGYNRHGVRVLIACIIPLLAIIVIMIFFCLHLMKSYRIKNSLQAEIVHKNKQIQSLDGLIDDDQRLIEVASINDNLTRVYNRRFFDTIVAKMNNNDATVLPLCIATVDVDGLKTINQCYGYHIGDKVLSGLAQRLNENAQETDVIARTGNSEFTLIMAGTKEKEAYQKVQVMLEGFERSEQEAVCTVSFGIACKEGREPDLYTLIEKSISNMQLAKLLKPSSRRYEMIQLIKNGLLERSNETEEHSERMGILSVKVGKLYGLSQPELIELEVAAYLHDIGKIAIPDHILTKSGPLDAKELRIMQQHPLIGARIARAIPDLSDIALVIEQHHERYNGEGYPYHLKGEQIHVMARIITIVDSYDAMTSNRVYSNAKSVEMAKAELIRCSGGHYDPQIIALFMQVLENENS